MSGPFKWMTELWDLHHFNKTASSAPQSVNTCSFFGVSCSFIQKIKVEWKGMEKKDEKL